MGNPAAWVAEVTPGATEDDVARAITAARGRDPRSIDPGLQGDRLAAKGSLDVLPPTTQERTRLDNQRVVLGGAPVDAERPMVDGEACQLDTDLVIVLSRAAEPPLPGRILWTRSGGGRTGHRAPSAGSPRRDAFTEHWAIASLRRAIHRLRRVGRAARPSREGHDGLVQEQVPRQVAGRGALT